MDDEREQRRGEGDRAESVLDRDDQLRLVGVVLQNVHRADRAPAVANGHGSAGIEGRHIELRAEGRLALERGFDLRGRGGVGVKRVIERRSLRVGDEHALKPRRVEQRQNLPGVVLGERLHQREGRREHRRPAHERALLFGEHHDCSCTLLRYGFFVVCSSIVQSLGRGGYHPPATILPVFKRTVGATFGRPRGTG